MSVFTQKKYINLLVRLNRKDVFYLRMKNNIKWAKPALKSAKKLPEQDRERIVKKLRVIENSSIPFHYLDRLKNTRLYKLRVGDYRLLIDVVNKGSQRLFLIKKCNARSKIYKIND